VPAAPRSPTRATRTGLELADPLEGFPRSPQRRPGAPRSGVSGFAKPAKLTQAERDEFDSVNGDRVAAHVGLLNSSAVLQAIADLRVRQMAAKHADYAGYDVRVNAKRTHLCFKGVREIEGESLGTGGSEFPPYPSIELNPQWTSFADASYTADGATYTVQDYLQACAIKPPAPIALPTASLALKGLAVSIGPPAPSAAVLPLGSTFTDPVACNSQAGLYAVVRYTGPTGLVYGTVLAGGTIQHIQQTIASGTDAVQLATNLAGNQYGFALSFNYTLRLPDGDRIYIVLPNTTIGSQLAATVTPNCQGSDTVKSRTTIGRRTGTGSRGR
jgi:hypothetical protein